MLRKFGLVAVTALATLTATPSAQAHSLGDALVFAYTHSNLLEQQRFALRALDEDVAVAVSALRPTLSYFQNHTQNHSVTGLDTVTTTLGLQLEWLLLDGGARDSRIAASKEAVLASRYGLIELEQQMLLDAISAYVTLRQDIQTLNLRRNNLRLITQELRASEDRFEVGEVTRTDVSIAQSRLAAARSALAAAEGQVEVSREGYKLAIGRYPHGAQSLPAAPALPASEAAAKALALQVHPSITRIQHQVKAAELLAAAADQDRLPKMTFSARAQNTIDTGASHSATLGFSQPIYTGGRLSALSRKALANLHGTRSQLAQQGRAVSEAVGRNWALMMVSNAQVVASRQQVRSAQLAFDGVREEASLGARTTLDVLNAEQELLDARTALLEAQNRAYLATYTVLASIGLLTVDHLGLNVERYDPTVYYNAVSTAPAVSSEYGSRLDRVLKRYGGGND